MDLIKIAFGDDLTEDPLTTDEGQLIYAKFISLPTTN